MTDLINRDLRASAQFRATVDLQKLDSILAEFRGDTSDPHDLKLLNMILQGLDHSPRPRELYTFHLAWAALLFARRCLEEYLSDVEPNGLILPGPHMGDPTIIYHPEALYPEGWGPVRIATWGPYSKLRDDDVVVIETPTDQLWHQEKPILGGPRGWTRRALVNTAVELFRGIDPEEFNPEDEPHRYLTEIRITGYWLTFETAPRRGDEKTGAD